LRGNIDTRLAKVLDDPDGPYDAAIVAAAGVVRMGWEVRISEFLDVSLFTPAPAQGALAVECRANDKATRALLATIADVSATIEVDAERAFLRTVGGGCRSPLAAHAHVQGDIVRMWAMYADENMIQVATTEDEADTEDAEMLAARIARTLMDRVDGDG
jgi:hydroxymethylbilane synthase